METDILKKIKGNKPTSEPIYNCPKCKDMMFISTEDAQGYCYATPCDCREKRIANRLMLTSGLSEQDLKIGFTDFKVGENQSLANALNLAKSYFARYDQIQFKRNSSVLLSGLPGRGKTLLGLAIVNNLLKKGVQVKYISYRDMVVSLKQVVTDSEKYGEKMNKLKDCKVLFIDDLFKGNVTEADKNIIYELINHRYLAPRSLIISSEYTIDGLIGIDEAIGSRIAEMCKGFIIPFDESIPNYRLGGVYNG